MLLVLCHDCVVKEEARVVIKFGLGDRIYVVTGFSYRNRDWPMIPALQLGIRAKVYYYL